MQKLPHYTISDINFPMWFSFSKDWHKGNSGLKAQGIIIFSFPSDLLDYRITEQKKIEVLSDLHYSRSNVYPSEEMFVLHTQKAIPWGKKANNNLNLKTLIFLNPLNLRVVSITSSLSPGPAKMRNQIKWTHNVIRFEQKLSNYEQLYRTSWCQCETIIRFEFFTNNDSYATAYI